jgi:hypothetical protein
MITFVIIISVTASQTALADSRTKQAHCVDLIKTVNHVSTNCEILSVSTKVAHKNFQRMLPCVD